ncbi:histidine kinase [Erysipelotrichaceae bacterium 66202529]|nr:histidine kinase [Erysipelotrichaceae bacterium 66202529]DAU14250.1 MAG TPA: hypothetical protein [Caudoviricetes sp.]
MEGLEYVVTVIDTVLDTKKKRHIIGGILLSASMFFGSLAVTVLTVKNDSYEEE